MPAESLLLSYEAEQAAQDEQLSFAYADLIPREIDRSQKEFDYTGERLLRLEPDTYKALVKLLAEPRSQVSYRQIARWLHVTHRTIRGVELREGIPITTEKKGKLALWGHCAEMALEKLGDVIPGMTNGKDLSIAASICQQNINLLSGEATVRIETASSGDVFEKMRALHAELVAMAAAKPITATVVQNGFEGGNVAQIGAASVAAAGEGDQGSGVRCDSGSDGLLESSLVAGNDPTELDADCLVGAGHSAGPDEGGRGSEFPRGGVDPKIGVPIPDFIPKGGETP